MSDCHDENEGKAISLADERRVRDLLDPSTRSGRVCLRMLEHGETIGDACAAEGTDPRSVMADWHRLTDENEILSVDGRRPCISVLASAWKRRWESPDAPLWAPMGTEFPAAPYAGPFSR